MNLGDRVTFRKAHACGGNEWEILRVGLDLRLQCSRCGRRILKSRGEFERQVRSIANRTEEDGE
ncbi:MAG: DUF951 domain-containing protein [Armatimonadetes bacterium]|nr:DUF951 domain-containing protein [Armatimonadota bacterium]